jgi:uncharacterized short protein YbdD (DUF466 family)
MLAELRTATRYLRQTLRLMVGVPDYDGYVAHMRTAHPERPIMSYAEFFQERQNARYSTRVGKCC